MYVLRYMLSPLKLLIRFTNVETNLFHKVLNLFNFTISIYALTIYRILFTIEICLLSQVYLEQ